VVHRPLHQQDVGRVVGADVGVGGIAVEAIEGVGAGVAGGDVEDEHVHAGTAAQAVAAGLALEPVGAVAAPEDVVAAAAAVLLVAGAPNRPVAAAGGVGLAVEGVGRADHGVAVEVLVAALAVEEVLAEVAIEPVAIGPAVQLVAGPLGLGNRVGRRGE